MDAGSGRSRAGWAAAAWQCLLAIVMLAGALAASAQPAGVRASGLTDAQAAATLSVLQRAMLYNDREAVARLIAFPLRVRLAGGEEQVGDASAFVRDYSRFVTPTLRRAVLAQQPAALLHGARGVQIGRGEVWLAAQCVPPGCTSTVVRIVALNPAPEALAEAGEPVVSASPAAPAPAPVPAPAPAQAPLPVPAPAPVPPVSTAPSADLPVPAPDPASAPAISARAAETQAAFVNRVWQVRRSNAVAPGTLYSFLSEGTLVIASPNGTPALGRWRVDGERLTMLETGRPYPVDILVLRRDLFSIRVRGPGEPVDIEFEPAAR